MKKQNDEPKDYHLFKVRFMNHVIGVIKGVRGCRKTTVVKNVLKKMGFKSIEEYLSMFPGNLNFNSDMFQISFDDQTKVRFQYGSCQYESYKAYYKVNNVFEYYGSFYKSSMKRFFKDKTSGEGIVYPTIQDVKDVLDEYLYDEDMCGYYYTKSKGDPDQLDDSRYKNVQFYMCEDWTEDWVDNIKTKKKRSKRASITDICTSTETH